MRKDETTISVSDLARMVRLSRGTIQHYEKIGVLDPKDADERHRYSLIDAVRLTNAVTLRNLGMDLSDIVPLLDGNPFASENVPSLLESLATRRELIEAQEDMLRRLLRLLTDDGEPKLVDVERYFFKPTVLWSPELGVSEAGDEPMFMPVSGAGAVFEGNPLMPTALHGGRTVLVRYARLITGFESSLPVIGGCRCAAVAWDANMLFSSLWKDAVSQWAPVFKMLDEFLRQRRLCPAGPAFIPLNAAIYGEQRNLVCLPVRKRGLFEPVLSSAHR